MVLTVVGGKRCYVVRLPNERRIVVSEAATVPACYCTAGSTTTTPRTTLFLMWKNCGVLSHLIYGNSFVNAAFGSGKNLANQIL